MKKQNIIKSNFYILACVFISLSFFLISCGGGGGGGGVAAGGGGIFAAIEQEEKINKATAPGKITSMACLNGACFCTSNSTYVYSKGMGGRGWSKVGNYGYGATLLVASNASSLYCLVADNVEGDNKRVLNCTSGHLVSGFSGNIHCIIDNQAVGARAADRRAYVITESGCYILSGDTATAAAGGGASTRGCVLNGSSDVFANTHRICANYNYTAYYTASDEGLSSNWADAHIDKEQMGPILAIAYYQDGSGSYIAVATGKSGYRMVRSDGEIHDNPQPNANQFSGFGCVAGGMWILPTTNGYAMYYAINTTDSTRDGLWSCYPGGKWNLD